MKVSSIPMVLLEPVPESPEGLVKTDCWTLPSQFLSVGLGGTPN